jgi:NADH-quinone oxidoreductase subunit N
MGEASVNSTDFLAILPQIIILAASVIVLLIVAVHRNHKLTVLLTIAGEIAAFAAIPFISPLAPHQSTSLLMTDQYSLFFAALLIAAAFAATLLSYGYLEKRGEEKEEFYILLLLATLGALVLSSGSHFVSFFLGLEVLSVSLYIMIAYMGTARKPLEAGLKYLILAGTSSAFLLFGMALVYTETGKMDFMGIAAAARGPNLLVLSGFALIISGLGFKLAIVPFHMWTPDVYQGSPAPVAAFVATVSKGAVFSLLFRYFVQTNATEYHPLFIVLTVVSIASMTAGNILALLQTNLKRLLAYSSISHLGYLLVAYLASPVVAVPASSFYLVAYFISILAAFGVISVMSPNDREAEDLHEYQGLFWRRPWLAAALSASMFSLAGIPLTAGFVGKFYLLAAGIGSARWLLVVILVVTSAIGLFYYLRTIVALYSSPSPITEQAARVAIPAESWMSGFVIAGLMILLIWLGVYPSGLMRLIQAATL